MEKRKNLFIQWNLQKDGSLRPTIHSDNNQMKEEKEPLWFRLALLVIVVIGMILVVILAK